MSIAVFFVAAAIGFLAMRRVYDYPGYGSANAVDLQAAWMIDMTPNAEVATAWRDGGPLRYRQSQNKQDNAAKATNRPNVTPPKNQ